MVLKKAAMGVQMDREAILQQTPEPTPASRPGAAAEPQAEIVTEPAGTTSPRPAAPARPTAPKVGAARPVVDLRQAPAEDIAPVAVPSAPPAPQPAAAKPTARRDPKPKPAPAPTAPPVVGWSYTVLLTEEQWAWVESEASRRGIAKRYVLLSAVDKHRNAIDDHFRTTVQESASLFHWTGEPKDVEGRKVSKSLRFPPAEREILQGLIEEAGAPSMAMYLRIAADIEMKAQGKA